MTLVDVNLKLPEDLVKAAREAGILTDSRFESFLLEELARLQKVDTLFDDIEKLHRVQPPLTPDEIDDEIRDYKLSSKSSRDQA